MKKYCYLNGKIVETAKASVAINDLSVLRGYGVFDFLKTVNGKLFLWKEHWRRFQNSAKSLGLKVPVGEAEVKKIILVLLKKNLPRRQAGKYQEASVRLLLTGGQTPDGMTVAKPVFAILLEDIYYYPAKHFTHGAKVMTHEYQRFLPASKTTNYITAIRLAKEKKKAGAVEILFTYRGKILECSTSNFFIVKEGKIITPKIDILYGTTRNVIMTLAKKAGYKVEEREMKVGELRTADEAFLTATNKDVMPIVQVDSRKINRGKVGPVTKHLMTLFTEFVAGY